ncbi:uncharacterized protein LOC144530626 [Sander vitreus]
MGSKQKRNICHLAMVYFLLSSTSPAAVSLPKPSISMNPVGEVTWGQDVGITCLISTQVLGGTFILQHSSGSSRKTETHTNSATFNIHQVDIDNEGSYQCQYQTRNSSQDLIFISPQSDFVRLSVSVPLQQPNISLTSPNRGLVWGPEGAQITRGFSFVFTCSTSSHYPGGVFHLIFSGSNLTNTEPVVNQSASFSFPVAEYEHRGNYSCVYEVTLSSKRFTSTQTAPISVVIKMHLLLLVSSVAAGGLLLLLLVLVVVCLVCKRRRRAKHPGALIQTELAVGVRNDSEDESEDDEADYINVDPMDTTKKLKEEAGKGEEEETNDHVKPESDEDHDYEEAGPSASIPKTNEVYFSVEEEEEEDNEDDYVNVDPMDTTKKLKEEAGKGEEEETNDHVEPESDEDHDYEEAGPSASIPKTNEVHFSVEEEEEEDNEDDYVNVDPMDTTKKLKEEAGKGEEKETNDHVKPESDEDHDYEEAGPSASIPKTNEVYFSVEEEEEEDNEDDYVNVDPMETTKKLKEEAGKGEEEETNDHVEPESDEDHDYEEAGPSASILKTNKV